MAGTHLISLPHVAVEDSSHALDCGMLQLMIPAHVVINAPGEEGKHHWMMHRDEGPQRPEELDRTVVCVFKMYIVF